MLSKSVLIIIRTSTKNVKDKRTVIKFVDLILIAIVSAVYIVYTYLYYVPILYRGKVNFQLASVKMQKRQQ